MLNYILVGYGVKNRVADFSQKICNDFREVLAECNAHIYDMDSLVLAESNKKYLKRKSRLVFPTKRDKDKTYWIIMGEPDYDELYKRWFFSSPEDFFRYFAPVPTGRGGKHTVIDYSHEHLVELLNKLFPIDPVAEWEPQSSGTCDISLKYCFRELAEKNVCCQITLCMTDKAAARNPINYFKTQISQLDAEFPDVFSSAYITNGTEFHPIRNLSFCSFYDYEALNRRILGAEYSVYVNDRLDKLSADTELVHYRIDRLTHGQQYTFDGDIRKFDCVVYRMATAFFKEILIPVYAIPPWQSLCDSDDTYPQIPEMISVYNRPNDPFGYPFLLFSSGYTAKQTDQIAALYVVDPPELLERYQTTNEC